jgi:hypothetical protein
MSPDRKNLLAIEEEEESLAIAPLFLSSSLKLAVPLNFKRKKKSQA